MKKKIGFIGCGKMAQAMIEGIIASKLVEKNNVMASASTSETLFYVQNQFGINVTKDNREVAKFADLLILAVKPIHYGKIIEDISSILKTSTVIVTIAAGISLADIEAAFGRKVKTVRTMPNTPSLVGEGMTALCPNDQITEKELTLVEQFFNSFGETEIIEENLMDAIPAISGSSPAYVYMMIEAMADGGVKLGIPRNKAYNLAAQAVLGAAKMVLKTNKHPGALKDDVCTPGGATIEAVGELERNQFRGAVLKAMDRCYAKTKEMSKA